MSKGDAVFIPDAAGFVDGRRAKPADLLTSVERTQAWREHPATVSAIFFLSTSTPLERFDMSSIGRALQDVTGASVHGAQHSLSRPYTKLVSSAHVSTLILTCRVRPCRRPEEIIPRLPRDRKGQPCGDLMDPP